MRTVTTGPQFVYAMEHTYFMLIVASPSTKNKPRI